MAKRSKGLTVLPLVPGADNLRKVLEALGRAQPTIVTSLESGKILALKEIAEPLCEENPELSVLDWRQAVQSELIRMHFDASPPSNGHVLTAVARAMQDLAEDRPLARVAGFVGAHEAVMRVADEFRAYKLEPRDVIERAPEGSNLRAKLEDLATIIESSELELARLQRVFLSRTMTDCMQDDAPQKPLHRWIVHVGSTVHPFARDWLTWLAQQGCDVLVVCDSHASHPDMFAGSRWWLGQPRPPEGNASLLAERLFTPSEPLPLGNSPSVTVLRASDPLAECEWVIRLCAEKIGQGEDPASITILARSHDDYTPLLQAASTRFGVPLCQPERAELLSNAFARTWVGVLEGMTKKHPTQFLRLTRQIGMTLPTLESEDGYEGAPRWKDLETLTEDSPLRALLLWRAQALSERRNLDGWHDMLAKLAEQEWCTASIERSGEFAERDRHAHSGLRRAISTAASFERLQEHPPVDFATFLVRARRLWEQETITVPSLDNGVRVCREASMIGSQGTLMILGTIEGSFPRRRREEPVLSDDERATISEGLPDSHSRALEERDEFYRAVASAGSDLVISYCETTGESFNIPAHFINHILELVPDAVSIVHARRELFPAEPACLVDQQLKAALDLPKLPRTGFEIHTEDSRQVIASSLQGVSIRALERATVCRFQFFLQDVCKYPSYRHSTPLGLARVIPQRGGLVHQPNQETARRALHSVLDELLAELDLPHHQTILMRMVSERAIEAWIDREFRARELWSPVPAPDVYFDGGSFHRHAPHTSITLRGGLDNVQKIAGQTVFTIYSTSDPIDTKNQDRSARERLVGPDAFRMALGFYFLKVNAAPIAFMVDHPGGRRMVQWSGLPLPQLSQADMEFKRSTFGTALDRSDIRKWIQETLEAVDAAIKQGDLEPDPAVASVECPFCGFGDVCRRHVDFGEESPIEVLPTWK